MKAYKSFKSVIPVLQSSFLRAFASLFAVLMVNFKSFFICRQLLFREPLYSLLRFLLHWLVSFHYFDQTPEYRLYCAAPKLLHSLAFFSAYTFISCSIFLSIGCYCYSFWPRIFCQTSWPQWTCIAALPGWFIFFL